MKTKKNLPITKAHRILSPRIAYLVTTVDKKGRVNAAAFSNITSVSSKPQRVVLAVYTEWDTLKNLRVKGECVINVPSKKLLEEVWICGDKYAGNPIPTSVNELDIAGLTALPSKKVAPPRIAECFGHLECKVKWIKNVGDHDLILADIVAASYTTGAFNKELIPQVHKTKPLLEVTGGFFASPGNITPVNRDRIRTIVAARLKKRNIKIPKRLRRYIGGRFGKV